MNVVTIEQMIEAFTGDGSREGGVFVGPPGTGPSSDQYALPLRFSYLPRREGATKIEGSLECHLDVLKS